MKQVIAAAHRSFVRNLGSGRRFDHNFGRNLVDHSHLAGHNHLADRNHLVDRNHLAGRSLVGRSLVADRNPVDHSSGRNPAVRKTDRPVAGRRTAAAAHPNQIVLVARETWVQAPAPAQVQVQAVSEEVELPWEEEQPEKAQV